MLAEAGTEETREFVRRVRRATRRKFMGAPYRPHLTRHPGRLQRPNVYYSWLKDFTEAGKARLQADTVRNATRAEVDSKGNPWLRSGLVEAAQTAGRTKTYLGEQYHRIAARRGKRRAAVAVAHSLIVIVYHILASGRSYEDLGYRYFDERDRQRTTQRLVHRLSALGYNVTLDLVA